MRVRNNPFKNFKKVLFWEILTFLYDNKGSDVSIYIFALKNSYLSYDNLGGFDFQKNVFEKEN